MNREFGSDKKHSSSSSSKIIETGEEFYTNISKAGYRGPDGKHISLEDYLKKLKSIYPSVIVKDIAVDAFGTKLENDVAIFVGKTKIKP